MPGEKNMPSPPRPLKWYRKLANKKGRSEGGAFLVEGERAIRQIMDANPEEIIEIVATEELVLPYSHYPQRLVTERQFRYISATKTPQGIMAIVRMPEDIYTARLPQSTGKKILLLEDIQDPGNVGTLIRTAAAFDFSGVLLTENCADPLAPKCVQATAGAVLSVWLRRTAHYLELARSLRTGGYSLVAAELEGAEETTVLQLEKLLLALGNEAAGLTKSILNEADYRLKIPTVKKKAESLNVAACGAILMYLTIT